MTVEVFLSEEAARDRRRLTPDQEHRLGLLASRLRGDPTLGVQVRSERIPASLRARHRATNLWRLPLPGGWRVLYMLEGTKEREVSVYILRILDHREYDRLFGYRTS